MHTRHTTEPDYLRSPMLVEGLSRTMHPNKGTENMAGLQAVVLLLGPKRGDNKDIKNIAVTLLSQEWNMYGQPKGK